MRESFYHYQFSHSLVACSYRRWKQTCPRNRDQYTIVCGHNLPSRLTTQSNLFAGMYMKANAI